MPRLFVRNLTVLDFAFLHGERGLLGESWRVHVELRGALDHQGMVLDFADVKREIKRTLDTHLDHRLLVPTGHPGLQHHSTDGLVELSFTLADGRRILHRSPAEAVAWIDAAAVTTESVTARALQLLQPLLPANVEDLILTLEPEHIEAAYFHYAHGLKQHCGNCQRIAHGHRSRIEIYRDDQRDPALEQDWAERWRDIYIATRSDRQAELTEDGAPAWRFGYEAAQGRFELTLPAERCYLVDGDSTIENLAQHVADTLAHEHPGQRITARVFEGIDKGAIGEAGEEKSRGPRA
jgi:6-pyruvoyl-tetrahydropterin synthase